MNEQERDEIIAQGVVITTAMVYAVQRALATIRVGPEPGEERTALAHWHAYYCTLTIEVGFALCELAKSDMPRAMAILNRSLFEYVEKSSYFLRHPDTALQQYKTIPIRDWAAKSRVLGKFDIAAEIDAAYEEWSENNPEFTEFTGNQPLLRMHLDNVDEDEILLDPRRKSNSRYTRRYQALHDLPSFVVHGEAVLMYDAIPDVRLPGYRAPEQLKVNVRSSLFMTVREFSKAQPLLVQFLINMVRDLNADVPELEYLSSEMMRWRTRTDPITPTQWREG